MPAPGVLRVLSRPDPSRQRVLRCRLVDAEVGRRSVARRGTGPGRTGRPGSVPFVSAYFFLLEFKFDEKLLGGGGGSDGGGSGDGDGGSGTDPHPSHHPPTPSLRWRRATVGAGWGAAAATGGGLAGGGASQSVRRRVPVAGKGWVAPRRPSRRPPRVSMCMRRPTGRRFHLTISVPLYGALVCILSVS